MIHRYHDNWSNWRLRAVSPYAMYKTKMSAGSPADSAEAQIQDEVDEILLLLMDCWGPLQKLSPDLKIIQM